MPEQLSGSDFAKEILRRRTANLRLKGKTFPVKDKIKELGGIWDNQEKVWLMPTVQAALQAGGVPKDDHFEIPKAE